MVPAGIGRAELPSENDGAGSSGRYAGWSAMLWRQEKSESDAHTHAATARTLRKVRRLSALVFNLVDSCCSQPLQHSPHGCQIEARIPGFDAKEKPVP